MPPSARTKRLPLCKKIVLSCKVNGSNFDVNYRRVYDWMIHNWDSSFGVSFGSHLLITSGVDVVSFELFCLVGLSL